MSFTLVRLVVRARALSVARSTAAIATAEPGWFLFVTVALIGGGVIAALRLTPRLQIVALGVMAMGLTLVLTMTRRDAVLHRVIGVAPGPVRVIEGLLWSSPLIAVAAMLSLRASAVIAGTVAATAYVAVGVRGTTPSRTARRSSRGIMPRIFALLPEWTVGLRRTAPIVAVALLAGIVGSDSPGIVVMAMATLALITSAFFWAPAEGWLLIHAREQTASRFLLHKLATSVGLLSVLLVPIALVGAFRAPAYAGAYALTLAIALHAHAAAVAVKYASYREGRALDAAGNMVWMITALAIVVPPVGLLLLVWLYRRAVARIAAYCPGALHAR